MNVFAMAFGLMSRKCSGRQERVDFAHKGHHGRAPFWLRTSEAVLTKMTKAWYICQFNCQRKLVTEKAEHLSLVDGNAIKCQAFWTAMKWFSNAKVQ